MSKEKKSIKLAKAHVHFHADRHEFVEYKAGDTLEDVAEVIDKLSKNAELVGKASKSKDGDK